MRSNFLYVWGSLLGALFLFTTTAKAQNWKDPQWLRLLHYNESWVGGFKSEADGDGFFLSPEGHKSPKKELEAYLQHLQVDDADQKKNAFCRFPARLRWLKNQGVIIPQSKVVCENLREFRERLSAKSVAIVFSSYYLGNPASSFGHTFLRLGKSAGSLSEDNATTELLDTGINFGAVTGNASALLYSIGGLTGYFIGTFDAVPYFYKVRHYNDYESRDLWSYQLNLTHTEIDTLVEHVWELGHTYFDYYFLTQNCSYHMLTLLETIRPSVNLRKHLPNLYTIPSQTLKALTAENLVSKVAFRPSAASQFYRQLQMLNQKEREAVDQIVFKRGTYAEGTDEQRALVYDTAISLVDYKYAKQVLKQEKTAMDIKRPILLARSKIPVRSPELDFSEKLRKGPHLGHGQKRLAISGINRKGKNYLDLDWRFAFHDALDYSVGYPPKTKLEVGRASLRTDGDTYQVRDFALVDVNVLGSWDVYNKASSWKMRLGQNMTRYQGEELTALGASGGYGYAYALGFASLFALVHGEGSYVGEKLHKSKFAYGSDQGVLFDLTDNFKFQTSIEWRAYPWSESRFINEMRFSNARYGLGLYHQAYLSDGLQDLGIRMLFYF